MNQDQLNVDVLRNALVGEEIGHTVELHGSVPSTMPLAKSLADDAAIPSGAVVLAEEQTAGRGRLSRSWEAPYGEALLMTVVLKPPALDFPPPYLPMAVALSIYEAVLHAAPSLDGRVAIKWPNDILINRRPERDAPRDVEVPGDWRKVAGILIETAYAGFSMTYALIGMGINANQDRSSLPPMGMGGISATSICQYLAGSVDRSALAITLCKRLGHWLACARQDKDDALFETWRERQLTTGYRVTIQNQEGAPIVSGIAESVDHDGRLRVRGDDGKLSYVSRRRCESAIMKDVSYEAAS